MDPPGLCGLRRMHACAPTISRRGAPANRASSLDPLGLLYRLRLSPAGRPHPHEHMITFDRLGKTYGDFAAVRDLELGIARGEVFGFLGPNGAGKTTTIRMMMGILVPTSGRATIDGLDCQTKRVELKRRVGYLPENPMF